jgi:hypothetical protein
MSRIIIKALDGAGSFNALDVRLASIEGRSERLRARLAEIDVGYMKELKRLKKVVVSAHKYYKGVYND